MISHQVNKQNAEMTLLSVVAVERSLSVSHLADGETCISIRSGDDCVTYSMNDAEMDAVVAWLTKKPNAPHQPPGGAQK